MDGYKTIYTFHNYLKITSLVISVYIGIYSLVKIGSWSEQTKQIFRHGDFMYHKCKLVATTSVFPKV